MQLLHLLLNFQYARSTQAYIVYPFPPIKLNPGLPTTAQILLTSPLQAQSLSEISVECGNANILTLAEEQLSYEGMLSIEDPDHDILKKPVVYHSHFTKKRKIIFLANGYNNYYVPLLVLYENMQHLHGC